MKTRDMLKELTENPNKKFSCIDKLGLEITACVDEGDIFISWYNPMTGEDGIAGLPVDGTWREVLPKCDFDYCSFEVNGRCVGVGNAREKCKYLMLIG